MKRGGTLEIVKFDKYRSRENKQIRIKNCETSNFVFD